MAVTVLAGAGELPLEPLQGVVLLGELGLDGAVRPVRGVLPGVLAAVRAGIRRVVVPAGNAREAALVGGRYRQAGGGAGVDGDTAGPQRLGERRAAVDGQGAEVELSGADDRVEES